MPKTDRAFRALSRQEPDVIAALLRVVKPGLVPASAMLVPEDVVPTQIDGLPPEMDADWAARVNDDELLHMECQGYRDTGFSSRVLWYHVGFALRNRGKRRVRTVALWLSPPPADQRLGIVTVGDISVRMTMIVLSEVPAAKLLEDERTACFAAGAHAGDWSDVELCRRVVAALSARKASWVERHMAVVAALTQKRYDVMVAAMEQANMEPVIIEDLVKFGEDRGFDRGVERTFERQFARRLGRSLTQTERDTLGQRLVTLGVERLDDVLFSLGQEAIAAWLADPSAA
ncbi:MAG: hypothetical protein IPM54_32675 [Polyangiaceae bacterium]|nr:hypothetical protein [Polyangiaceae bacterium]